MFLYFTHTLQEWWDNTTETSCPSKMTETSLYEVDLLLTQEFLPLCAVMKS